MKKHVNITLKFLQANSFHQVMGGTDKQRHYLIFIRS